MRFSLTVNAVSKTNFNICHNSLIKQSGLHLSGENIILIISVSYYNLKINKIKYAEI